MEVVGMGALHKESLLDQFAERRVPWNMELPGSGLRSHL